MFFGPDEAEERVDLLIDAGTVIEYSARLGHPAAEAALARRARRPPE